MDYALKSSDVKRDETFDIMKGIGILAMIIGHSPIHPIIWKLIFVWHIPLFFLVSGYFYKPRPIGIYWKENARRLLLPYFATSLVLIFIAGVRMIITGKGSLLNKTIAALIVNGTSRYEGLSEYVIGAIWFLFALFWCRCVYNTIWVCVGNYYRGIAVLAITAIATYIGMSFFIPTCILQGLSALLFFYIGHLAKVYRLLDKIRLNWLLVFLILVLYLLSVNSGALSMVRCFYGFWPINYLAAIGVCVLIFYLSKLLQRAKFLLWCGRFSLIVLCVHIVELSSISLRSLHGQLLMIPQFDFIIHIFVSVVISYLLIQIKFIKKVFVIH